MDLTSKNMYDTFKDEIWKELGPLDPDWFDVLTSQTFTNEGNVSDQDELCANQEGNFKAPFDRTAIESQLFSTPRVFRHSHVVSPETEDEHSFTNEQDKDTLPWTATQSPCLFRMSVEGVSGAKYGGMQPQSQDSFDLLHTPQKSPVNYAKQISESLGAQIHPDISWTSSLNTPPAVPSTLILSRTDDDSPCPVSVSADKNVVIVRKLFPSLSNASRIGPLSPRNTDMPALHQGVVSPEADQNPEPHDSPQSSLNQSESVWQQKLPDAIEDGDVRSTVASVLDGAENVLSIFFANSNSALRKVKPERNKRKQIVQRKEHGCGSTDISATERKTDDQEPGKFSSSPLGKTVVTGISQWSPLSLSEIPPSTVDTSCHDKNPATEVENKFLTEQLHSDSSQLVVPPLKDSGLIKKKRKFIYTVDTLKIQDQGKEVQSLKRDSSPRTPDFGHEMSVTQLGKTRDEIKKQENTSKETIPSSLQAKVQDLDISQLCRDFEEDFSQMSDFAKLSKVAQDAPHNNFSPSACLSVMKQVKQKARQANLHQDCDVTGNTRHASATNPNFSINGSTVSDSGFHSAVADISHVTTTSFVLPSSEDNSQNQTDFKSETHRIECVLSTNKGNGNSHLENILQETRAKLCSAIKESQTLGSGTESELHKESTSTQLPSSAKGTVDNINCILLNGQVNGDLPEKTIVSFPPIDASGFKTASNKGIQISSTNLERAKRLFQESEAERTFSDQPTKSAYDTKDEISSSHGSSKNTASDSNQLSSSSEKCGNVSCQLTASQKADVTELCTLLEEADSQFEFTQFKAAKLKQHCHDNPTPFQRVDKELDPDFLAGIDFDDSFTSDAEKLTDNCGTVMPDKFNSVSLGETNCSTSVDTSVSSAAKKENSSVEDVFSSLNHISEGSSSIRSAQPKALARPEYSEINKQGKKNSVIFGEGFKTAGGNVLRVSKEHLSKARAMFADIEENLKDQKSPDKQSSKMDAKVKQGQISIADAAKIFKHSKRPTPACQSEFQMASGKRISVSAKHMQEADVFFSDCNIFDSNTGMLVKHEKSILPGSVSHKNPEPKKLSLIQGNLSEEPVREFDKDFGSSALTELSSGCGFITASGKKVSVSPDALKKAECVFNEIHTLEEANTQLKEKGDALRAGHPTNQIQVAQSKNGGFQTASGKGVVISSAALKKAKSLLSECEDNTSGKPTNSKMPVRGPPHKNHGFLAASGKPVAVSAEALQKVKAVFRDIDFSVDTRDSNKTQHNTGKTEQTVQKNILNSMPVKHEENIGLVSVSEKKTLSKFKPDKKLASVDPGSGCAELENVELATHHENALQLVDVELNKAGFKNTPNSANAASLLSSVFTKPLYSPLCITSKKTGSSALSEFSSGGGFCTDGMEKVSVSDDTLAKENSPLCESIAFEDTNKKLKHCEGTFQPQNAGFQTASGKGVAISSAALKKAKTLLSECEGVGNEIGVKPTYFKIPVPGPQCGNSGFHAASGKPVALSAEALQKANTLFSDINFSAETPAITNTRSSGETQDNAGKIHCGFMTAGGATVHVSQKNLLKAKNLFKEFDDAPISAKVIQTDTNVDPGFGRAKFENKHAGPVENHENVQHVDVESNKGAFKNTTDSADAGSLPEGPSLMAKPLSSQACTTSENIGSPSFSEFSSRGGICTASGKKVSVTHDAMTKSNCLLNESSAFENTNKKDTLPLQNIGFQTASGKGVAISSAALKKAKNLLSECEGVGDEIGVKPTNSKIPVPGPPPRNSGFHAASGKPVALSSEAVQKAKALFSDIDFTAESPTVSETRETSCAHSTTKEIRGGFTTAGGAKVHISQNSLLKAKNLLKEFADGDCQDSNSHVTRPHSTHKAHENETLHIQDSRVHGCISIKDKLPTHEFKCKDVKITSSAVDSWHKSPAEEMDLDYDVCQASFNERPKSKRAEPSSFHILQSLDLRGCTETQQRLLAQEALDCTKALLEDEGFTDQNLSVTLENVPLQDDSKPSISSVEEQKGRGKRSAEDADVTGQPPLKRRLLEEFDRTVDGPRGSTLHPEKSCPKGVMNDRRVFKYRDSLHPNITKPHRNGKTYIETRLQKTVPTQNSTPGETKAAHSKMPTFVPPFCKSTKTQNSKNTVVSDNIRASTFIPPFKKQKTVQESISKVQEEDMHHCSLALSNSNTYVPPIKKTQSTKDLTGIKKTQSTKDLTGSKSKDDIQTLVLAGTANDDLNLNHPVGCGSEDSTAEALGVEDTVSRNQDLFQNLENVELARDMQDMRIRKKKRQTIRPLPGSLFLTKTPGLSRISLKAAVNGKLPARYTQKQLYGYGVQQCVSEITSDTAESFRFNLQQFLKQETVIDCGGVQLADGGWLITSNDGTAGKEEFYRALCDTPGVDPKLISKEWVYNHYRWIVWKQASMERSFPETMGCHCLTPQQVLLQLKYRYDVEVDHSRRPALRKIMERDDTPAKTLVLCVCGVVSRGQSPNRKSLSYAKTPQGPDAKFENPSAVVWLTDGWYAIKAQLDEPLTAMLHKGLLAVGGKLIIHGAQLVGSQDACSPLEAPESLMLKICANSSRRARWDTKLGFHKDPRPFLLPVSCLYSNGGPVGCVDIIVLRSYPIQWMERKSDGGIVFRSVRAEQKEAQRYSSHKQKAMEILFAKIQAEFEREEKGNNKPQRRRRTMSHQDIASLQDGEELYEAVGDDPAYLEAHLSEQQLETLHTYRRFLMEKKQAELQDRYHRALEAEDNEGSCLKRDVTPVWRLYIADSNGQPSSVYQLNLWRPSSDLQSLLKEGCRYKVYNLTTSDGKKRSGVETLQLTGTKRTQFQDLQVSQEWLAARFQPRVSTSFVDLQNTEFQPLCGEVDLTGYVISIIDGQGSSPAFYLADGNLNFVKVRCFSSLSQSGLEDVVKPRVFLALSNLQLRGQSTSPTSVVYAGDLTVFSTNPKEVHLRESLSQLRNVVQGHENFYLAAEEKLSHLIKSDGLSFISSPALQPRTPVSTVDRKQDTKTSQPVRSLGSFTPVSKNPSSKEKDPRSLKRRRALDYLSRIPSPPGLSCLSSAASPFVKKTFNPPRRSGTPSTLKTVQAPACKPVNLPVEDEWVNDEELAMIDTQALRVVDA